MMVSVGKNPALAQSICIILPSQNIKRKDSFRYDFQVVFISGQSSWQQGLTRLQEAQNGGGPAAKQRYNDWMLWDSFWWIFSPTRCTAQCCSFGCCNEFHCEGTVDTVRSYRHFTQVIYCIYTYCRLQIGLDLSRVSYFCVFSFLLGLVETRISACPWLIISGYSMGSCHGTFGPLVQLGRLRWLPVVKQGESQGNVQSF